MSKCGFCVGLHALRRIYQKEGATDLSLPAYFRHIALSRLEIRLHFCGRVNFAI